MLTLRIPRILRTRTNYLIESTLKLTLSSTHNEERIIRTNYEIRCQLATAYRALDHLGMNEGIDNHLTAIAPSLTSSENVALIIPYGHQWSECTPEMLVGLDLEDSKVVEGDGEPTIQGRSIHLTVYRNRPNVKSIMHIHPVYATALSALEDPTIKMIHQNSTRYVKNVVYDTSYSGLADNDENNEAERMFKKLGDKDILFMANHGLTVVGRNTAHVFDLCYYFENAASIQILAYQTGKPLRYINDEVVEYTLKQWQEFDAEESEKHLMSYRAAFVRRDANFINPHNFHYKRLIATK